MAGLAASRGILPTSHPLSKETTMNPDALIQQLRSIRDTGDWSSNDDVTLEAIGCALAYAASWDGRAIMRVMSHALTDANFHRAAGKVDQMITDECGD
jgi:hypothetical protein